MLRIGDAHVTQNDAERVEKGLSCMKRAGQPVGIKLRGSIHLRHWNQTHSQPSEQIPPHPKRKKQRKKGTDIFFPHLHTLLLSLQSLASLPLKMETKDKKKYTQRNTTCACLSLSGLALPLSYKRCLSLIAWDARLSGCVTYLCPLHTPRHLWGLWATSVPVRTEGSRAALS